MDNHVIRYNPPEIFSQSKYYDNTEDKSKEYGSLVVGAESADPQLVKNLTVNYLLENLIKSYFCKHICHLFIQNVYIFFNFVHNKL